MSGFGIGLAFAAMPNLIVDSVPDTQTGIATGMNATVRTIGGSIGSQVVATVIAGGVVAGGVAHVANYAVSFAILGGSFLLAGLAAAMVPSRPTDEWVASAPTGSFRAVLPPAGDSVSA